MKGICLCSGGLDSTLALVKLLEQGHEVVPMFVDYNQWSLKGELDAMDSIYRWLHKNIPPASKLLGAMEWIKVSLNNYIGIEGVIGDETKVGSVWGRGIALVGLAAMWAYTHGDDYDFIALGNHKGDVGPDCKPGTFDYNLDAVLRAATKSRIKLLLPIRDLTIEDIGRELGTKMTPYEIIDLYSCYWYPPCGYKSENENYRCPGCRRKTIAMRAAGIVDDNFLSFPNGSKRTYQSNLAEKVGY